MGDATAGPAVAETSAAPNPGVMGGAVVGNPGVMGAAVVGNHGVMEAGMPLVALRTFGVEGMVSEAL